VPNRRSQQKFYVHERDAFFHDAPSAMARAPMLAPSSPDAAAMRCRRYFEAAADADATLRQPPKAPVRRARYMIDSAITPLFIYD